MTMMGNKDDDSPMRHFVDLSVSEDGKKLQVEVRDVDVSVVNSLRRSILSSVPCVAFDYRPTDPVDPGIRIYKNTTPLHHEMMGHRLSMVPICMDETQLAAFARDPQLYTFTLHMKNTGSEIVNVTSAHIKVMNGSTGSPMSESIRDAFFPACPITGDHILLVKLKPSPYGDGKGDEIHFDAKAVVNTGASHARWCPVSVATFVNKIDETQSKAAFDAQTASRQQQRKLASRPPMTSEEIEGAYKQFNCLEAMRYYQKDDYGEPRVFTFSVESEVGMRASFIVFKAFEVLISKIDAIRFALVHQDTDKISLSPCNEVPGFYEYRISGEGHTCGNLIQAFLYSEHFRNRKPEDSNISYVAYHHPHPLENDIILRLKLRDVSSDPDAFMIASMHDLSKRMRDYANEWIRVSRLEDPSVTPADVVDIIQQFAKR